MRQIIFATILAVLVSSCAVIQIGNIKDLNKKINRLEIGMLKEEVVNIVGDKYYSMNSSQTPDGVMDVIKYTDLYSYTFYMLYFLDNRLVEWNRDYDYQGAGIASQNQAEWLREQERQKEYNEMKDLRERELKLKEEALKRKESSKD